MRSVPVAAEGQPNRPLLVAPRSRARVVPAKPGPGGRLAHRRMAVYVGVAILLVTSFEAVSGGLLWGAPHRRPTLAADFLDPLPADRLQAAWIRWLFDVPTLTASHIWFGYLLLGLVGLKLW